jgi:hypothetical protein
MIDKGMVVLQNCMDLLEFVPASYSETNLTSADDVNQVMDIKVEDITNIQEEEEDPLSVRFPVKAEHEVSYVCVCTLLGIFHK